MVPDQITREIAIDAPVERVWSLITQPEHLGTWFADDGAEIDLRPGGALVLKWAEHGTHTARVEAVEPPHRFAFRWLAYHQREHATELTPETSTLVEFTLHPDGDGTKVSVVETGFAALGGSDEGRTISYEGNVRGWKSELGDLAAYAERQPA